MNSQLDPHDVIDALGGASEVAKLCGVTRPAVLHWHDNGIPRAWMMYFQATRPEIFAKLSRKRRKKTTK